MPQLSKSSCLSKMNFQTARSTSLLTLCSGWNHPGFYGSSGRPYPDQERMAADSVMQFAINKLGFKVENIIVMGWSIGGYTSTWLAMNYPEIKGLVSHT